MLEIVIIVFGWIYYKINNGLLKGKKITFLINIEKQKLELKNLSYV